MLKTISITVTGKVQGVFYRRHTREVADKLSITGIVRNLPDGSVFIQASGTDEQLEQLLDWCRQGPPKALVSGLFVEELPFQAFTSFSVQH